MMQKIDIINDGFIPWDVSQAESIINAEWSLPNTFENKTHKTISGIRLA